jgi:hypothetical protein
MIAFLYFAATQMTVFSYAACTARPRPAQLRLSRACSAMPAILTAPTRMLEASHSFPVPVRVALGLKISSSPGFSLLSFDGLRSSPSICLCKRQPCLTQRAYLQGSRPLCTPCRFLQCLCPLLHGPFSCVRNPMQLYNIRITCKAESLSGLITECKPVGIRTSIHFLVTPS